MSPAKTQHPRSAASAVRQKELPKRLRAYLAALAVANETAAELAITALPFGYRSLLETYNLITVTGPGADARDTETDEATVPRPGQRYRLTKAGWDVIKACAELEAKEQGSSADLDRREAALKERLANKVPFKPVTTRRH